MALHPSASSRNMHSTWSPKPSSVDTSNEDALYTQPLYYPTKETASLSGSSLQPAHEPSQVRRRVAYLRGLEMSDEHIVYQPPSSMLSKMMTLGVKTMSGVSRSLSFVVDGISKKGSGAENISDWVDGSMSQKGLLTALSGGTSSKTSAASSSTSMIPSITVSCEMGPFATHFYELRQNREGDDAVSVVSDGCLNHSVGSVVGDEGAACNSHPWDVAMPPQHHDGNSTDQVMSLIAEELYGEHRHTQSPCSSTTMNILVVPQWQERAATPDEIAIERSFAARAKQHEEQYWQGVAEARKRAVQRLRQGNAAAEPPITVPASVPFPTQVLRKTGSERHTAADSAPHVVINDAATFSRSPSQCSNLTEASSTMRATTTGRIRKPSVPFARPTTNNGRSGGSQPPRWNASGKVEAQPFRREASTSSVSSSVIDMSSQASSKGSTLHQQRRASLALGGTDSNRRGSIASQASLASQNPMKRTGLTSTSLPPTSVPPGAHMIPSVDTQQRAAAAEPLLGATVSSVDTASSGGAMEGGGGCTSENVPASPQATTSSVGRAEQPSTSVSTISPSPVGAPLDVTPSCSAPRQPIPWAGDWVFPTVLFAGIAPPLIRPPRKQTEAADEAPTKSPAAVLKEAAAIDMDEDASDATDLDPDEGTRQPSPSPCEPASGSGSPLTTIAECGVPPSTITATNVESSLQRPPVSLEVKGVDPTPIRGPSPRTDVAATPLEPPPSARGEEEAPSCTVGPTATLLPSATKPTASPNATGARQHVAATSRSTGSQQKRKASEKNCCIIC